MATILAIDDARSMRELLKSVLAQEGHEVVLAEDGDVALQVASTREVDVVLSDINMPHVNGLDLVRQLRQLKGYADTPILMMTTESANDKKQSAREGGADGWLQKPFSPDRLIMAVNRMLAKSGKTAA